MKDQTVINATIMEDFSTLISHADRSYELKSRKECQNRIITASAGFKRYLQSIPTREKNTKSPQHPMGPSPMSIT